MYFKYNESLVITLGSFIGLLVMVYFHENGVPHITIFKVIIGLLLFLGFLYIAVLLLFKFLGVLFCKYEQKQRKQDLLEKYEEE